MTLHVHRLLWALPFSEDNRILLRRLGVAAYARGYSNAQRLQIINGTLAIDPNDPEARNWQAEYSSSVDGSTLDYFAGSGSLTAAEWTRVQARIPFLPNGVLYARLAMNIDEDFELVETNVTALEPFIGNVRPDAELLTTAGLKPRLKN